MIESTILTGDAHIVPTTHSGLHLCGVWHLGNGRTQWEHNVRTDLSPKHGMLWDNEGWVYRVYHTAMVSQGTHVDVFWLRLTRLRK